MAKMARGGYGIRKSYSSDVLDKLGKDLEKQAKKSGEEKTEKAKNIRSFYFPKIKKLKKKVLSEFSKTDKVRYTEFKVYGKGNDISKDIIVVKYVIDIEDEDNKLREKIFNRVLDFVIEGIRRINLSQFFITKNFGHQEPLENNEVELLFLKTNHSWERIKNKPYITKTGDGEDRPEGPPGPPGGPPSPGGGFGEAPPPPEGGGGESPAPEEPAGEPEEPEG